MNRIMDVEDRRHLSRISSYMYEVGEIYNLLEQVEKKIISNPIPVINGGMW